MQNHILDLIIAYANGQCSDSEKQELEHWVNESDANKRQFKAYLQLCHNLADSRNNTVNRTGFLYRMRQKWWIPSSIAAGLLLSLWLGYQQYRISGPVLQVAETPVSVPQIQPGDTRAYLQIGDERITMDQNNTLAWSEDLSVLNQNGETIHHSSLEQDKPHTLVVPRGSEFDFTLADGTHVWLNSESSITFPAHFEKNKRAIQVQGEVYLEVSKDKNRPFHVALSQGNVQVLGTRFSVYDRPNEELYAVLVEGSIAYIDEEAKQHLVKPSEKIALNRKSRKISIKKIDTNHYTSWTKKMYVFNDQRLEDIMQTLARWYDFDFYFENEALKNEVFSGRLKRTQNLTNLLKSYEAIADIQFKMEGKKIYIHSKNKK